MTTEPPTTLSTVRVLLVEDNDDDAFLLQKDIKKGVEYPFVDDIDLTRVETLEAAVEACTNQSFDAIFLDLGLPDSRGIETVRRLTDDGIETPIVILTGLRDPETAMQAIQEGAQDYLIKNDITPESVVRTMRYAIERKDNERQIRRQRDQIEFFNSILRHDMLNGMQLIQHYSKELNAELGGEKQEMAEVVVKWSDNIVDLAEKTRDILDTLSGDQTAELEPVSVNDRTEDVVADIEEMREGVTVSTTCPADVTILADDLFTDVLRNLLVNAVEHTRPDPVSITVSVEPKGDTIRLVVADDGPGIANERKETVFERGETTSATSETGFGLYFVDTMVETYGGSIEVQDNEPSGTRFVLDLPTTSN